jgi:hypothetical protein
MQVGVNVVMTLSQVQDCGCRMKVIEIETEIERFISRHTQSNILLSGRRSANKCCFQPASLGHVQSRASK